MDEADKLRQHAKRALQLAEDVSDHYSNEALKTLAGTLLKQAERLEQTVLSTQQPQQQPQAKPTDEED